MWCAKGCGMRLGLALRDCLKVELESFESPFMATLTLNQERFTGPEDGLTWVQQQGVISEFVRILRKAGYLLDRRYVCVMEFQDNGWPHWHLIFDATFVPFEVLCEAWAQAGWAGRHGVERWGTRPKFEGKGQKPPFGAVNFRLKGRNSLGAVCHYLTKYVTKVPDGGWPLWLEKFQGQLRRWSTSRDFWRASPAPRSARKVTEFSKLRDKYFDPDEEWEEDDEFLRKIGKTKRSIGQRCESCGGASVVLEEVEVSPPPGESPAPPGSSSFRWRWVGMINAPVWEDPDEDAPTFRKLDEVGHGYFILPAAEVESVRLLKSLAGVES